MYRVFVFPTSNWVGLEIVQALSKSNKIELSGGSSYDTTHDPSRVILKTHVLCPGHEDSDFDERFLEILRKHSIDLVFPAWDPLVARFSDWDVPGVKFVVPNSATAHLVLSKRATYEAVAGAVPVPQCYDAESVEFPAFGKPDRGSGSKSTMMIESDADLRVALEKDLLISEYLPGEEYTCDCFSNLNGNFLFGNIRLRGRIGQGVALGSRYVHRPDILESCASIAQRIRIEGPWFAQFKVSVLGVPTLMEVNARIAGSGGLTRFSGVNIPLMSVFLFMGARVTVPKLSPGVLVNRTLVGNVETPAFKWVIWDMDDTLVRKDGKPDPDSMACLFDCHNRGLRQILVTKNPDPLGMLREHKIPNFFVEIRQTQDKILEVERILDEYQIDPRDGVMVNDAYSEILFLQERIPDLRIVTPDALCVLGREGLS